MPPVKGMPFTAPGRHQRRLFPRTLRCFHSSRGRTLPGDRRAHGAARREGGGGAVGVQSQHPEAGLGWFPLGLGRRMRLRRLGLAEPGRPSEEGRSAGTHPDRRETRRVQPSGGPVVFQRCASLPQPVQTVALLSFQLLKTP